MADNISINNNVSNWTGIEMVDDDGIIEEAKNLYRQQMVTYYIAIAITVTCCLGLVGNVVSLVVLTRKTMNSTTYIYLTGLAVCDLLVLIFTIITITKDTKKPQMYEIDWASSHYAYIFPWVHPLAMTFQVTSIWLTLAFTVDRYIMICWPFQAQKLCTKQRARRTIVGLYIGGLLFNIPKFFEYETHEIKIENITHAICELTAFGKSNIFREIFHSWLYLIFVCGVPFFMLALLNGFLIHAVHKSRQKGREINANDQKRNDTTIMLIGVVVVFFFCQAPALVSRMIWAFDPRLAFSNSSIYILGEVSNFLITLNSAINFVPYFFFGRRFRQECRIVICRCCITREALRRLSALSGTDLRRSSEASYTSKCTRTTNGSLEKDQRYLRPGSVMSWMRGSQERHTNEERIAFTTEVNHNKEKTLDEIQL